MLKDYVQVDWDDRLLTDFNVLLKLALDEDIGTAGDWTTASLIQEDAVGSCYVVSRKQAVVAGLPAAEAVCQAVDPTLEWVTYVNEGDFVGEGAKLAKISGQVRSILVAERLVLNFLGRLMGIATLTRKHVEEVEGTNVAIYDTRKTTPGWRLLEKYAVRRGGGRNHRSGLYEAILIKDNHLAFRLETLDCNSLQHAVAAARKFVLEHAKIVEQDALSEDAMSGKSDIVDKMIIGIEVDSLEQLTEVLPSNPDFVLLDNMSTKRMKRAVEIRDKIAPSVQLEASGGVQLRTIRKIAETGVERISVGALTHSAVSIDVGLDWE